MTERETDHRYREIDPTKLIDTVSKIAERVEEQFPGSGLSAVANEVASVAEGTVARVAEIKKPRIGLRIGVGIMVLLVLSGPLLFSFLLSFSEEVNNLGDFLEATDAGLHMLLVLAGGIFFLVGMENRIHRNQALASYLDFSGDLLSIVGKLAAYYAQNLSDRVVLDAVNEIETLTSSLSNKLWLKILVLREMMADAKRKPKAPAFRPGTPAIPL